MSDKKVLILMSTYNGEKYICEQLESIFNQTYKNIDILVRDDGSTDGTLDILREYENAGKLRVVAGENIGIWKSVHWLAANTGEADYYSFADQDDFWMSDKVERAVDALNKLDSEEPAMYFCNFDYYDEEMNFSSHRKAPDIELTFINALVNFVVYGFVCVINEKMRRLFLQMPPDVLYPHDYLMLILGTAFGNVAYDKDYAAAKYRRHGKNVSVTNESFFKIFLWRIKNFLLSDGFGYKGKWKWFSDVYANELSASDREMLSMFTGSGYSFKNAMRRAFYTRRYRAAISDELALRLMFLVGKL